MCDICYRKTKGLSDRGLARSSVKSWTSSRNTGSSPGPPFLKCDKKEWPEQPNLSRVGDDNEEDLN